MGANLENMLRAVSDGSQHGSRSPRHVFARLQLVSSLIRAESPPGQGGRLLWRNERGDVMALAVTRPIVIGRDGSCDLAFASSRVSRRHCVVRPSSDGVEVEDLGSSNGTFVNGARVRRRLLHDGDMIEFGGVVLVYAAG